MAQIMEPQFPETVLLYHVLEVVADEIRRDSSVVVCCIQHKSGGAYRTIQYAEKQGKKIVNLADEKRIGF